MSPILDWWILPHLAFYLWLASAIHAKWEPRWWVHALLCLFASYAWEIVEFFLSRSYLETWVVLEHPLNAWLVDPVTNGLGWLIGALVGVWSKNRAPHAKT